MLDLFDTAPVKAKNEDSREKVPTATAIIPSAPKTPAPKRASAVKGHSGGKAYVQASGGRIVVLDRVQVSIVLEDPFADHGSYPLEMSLETFLSRWSTPPPPDELASEYERLAVKQPAEAVPAVHDALLLALNNAATQLREWIEAVLANGEAE